MYFLSVFKLDIMSSLAIIVTITTLTGVCRNKPDIYFLVHNESSWTQVKTKKSRLLIALTVIKNSAFYCDRDFWNLKTWRHKKYGLKTFSCSHCDKKFGLFWQELEWKAPVWIYNLYSNWTSLQNRDKCDCKISPNFFSQLFQSIDNRQHLKLLNRIRNFLSAPSNDIEDVRRIAYWKILNNKCWQLIWMKWKSCKFVYKSWRI